MWPWRLAPAHQGYVALASSQLCNRGIVLGWKIPPSCRGAAPQQPMNIVPPAKLPLQMTPCATMLSEGPRSPRRAAAYPWQLPEAECHSWQDQPAPSGPIPELSTLKHQFGYESDRKWDSINVSHFSTAVP